MKLSGTSFPRSLWFGFEVNAAQSSGEWPGASITFREGLEEGGGIGDEGAMEEFERTFVGGTRSMEAADGGGRSAVQFVGRGGGGMALKVGGFNRGGSCEGVVIGTAGFEGSMGLPFGCGRFRNRRDCCASGGSPEDVKESEGVGVDLCKPFPSDVVLGEAELWVIEDVEVLSLCSIGLQIGCPVARATPSVLGFPGLV